MPEVMNRRRGLGERRRRGMNVEVMIWVPVVLMFQDWFHISRSVISPLESWLSNCAPTQIVNRLLDRLGQSRAIIPALLTKASTLPKFEFTVSKAALMESSCSMSI